MSAVFQIRCLKCRWGRMSNGSSDDLKDLNEIKNSCSNCGQKRKFKCPKCGLPATMHRIHQDTPNS